MSFAGGLGLKNVFGLGSLLLQDIVARSISLTQATGLVAVQLVTGARLKLGGGTTDYLTSNGAALITAAGDFSAASIAAGTGGMTSSGTNTLSGATPLNLTATTAGIWFNNAAAGAGLIESGISAANAGATAATAAFKMFTDNALDATDWVLSLGTAANAASLLAVRYDGGIVVPNTDSSGAPGNAAINQASGRSAIAAGAATVTITNSLSVAGSRVFISPLARDATGLSPTVTTHGAGSFTVTTTANCTASLSFDWFVLT